MRRILRIIGLICVVAMVAIALLFVSHGKERTAEQVGADKTITILTYNSCRMGFYRKFPDNRVLHYLRRTDADIVCLQEVDVYKNNKYLTFPELKDAMRQYPYSYYDFKIYNSRRQFGNVIYSKYPLINKHTVPYESLANISSRCDVVIGQDTIRLFTNHLESNSFTRADWHVDSLTSEQLKESAHRISDKLDKARGLRRQQAKIVKQEINKSPYPVIVVGDFNSIPLSYTYLKLKRGLRDCFLTTSSWRLGNTFVKRHLGIRIDYILCSKVLHPLQCTIDHVDYSDHYPMRVTMGLSSSVPERP